MCRPLDEFSVRFWGTRGSIPSPGPETLKYGGNTSCVEVRCGGELIILDAGTGIRNLGTELMKEMPVKASILFSHVHWDHIQGIPFFRPAYISGNEFKLYGSKNWDTKLKDVLKWQMHKPCFPMTLEEVNAVGAKMEYTDIDAGTIFSIGDNDEITVRTAELRHPDRAFGFRIEYNGRSLVYATDTEGSPMPDEALVELSYGTDLLIHDAQYTSKEYYELSSDCGINWGHSTPEAAVEVAIAANVKELALFHHNPYHDDATIDRMLEEASAIFPNTVAAYEDMVIELQPAMVPAQFRTEEMSLPLVYSLVPEPS